VLPAAYLFLSCFTFLSSQSLAVLARTLMRHYLLPSCWPLVGTPSPVANTYTPSRGLLCSTVIANKLISRTSKR
jgi:hypothetical protein